MSTEPAVFVIILNFNHIEDLKETISSFHLQSYSNMHLVVSDNGSKDNSIEWIKRNYPGIKVLENGENLGWAEGNNVGIRYAIGKGADYILLANNDLSFSDPHVISRLVGQVTGHEKWIIGPIQNYYYDPEYTFSRGHYFMNIREPAFNELRYNFTKGNELSDGLEIVDYAAGSFVMFPAGLIKEVGYIDEAFYLYGEDADFFLRAWKHGYISMVDTGVMILHKISATSGSSSPLKRYYQSRNIWLNLRKHSDITDNLAYFITLAIKGLIKNLFLDLFNLRLQLAFASIKGTWHGLVSKKYGKVASF